MAPPGKTMLEKADAVVEISKKPLYLVTMGFVYIGYIILFLGISYISPDYIRFISNITYVIIGLVLIANLIIIWLTTSWIYFVNLI